MPAFSRFEEEGKIVGRLVVGYGEIEYLWMLCLSEAVGDDINKATRALFRSRSEAQRLEVGDALMRDYYASIGLADKYSTTFGAIKHCKKIRNQYAHCHWHDTPSDGLKFTYLEKAAKSREGNTTLRFYPIDAELLREQEDYFVFTTDCLVYLYERSESLRGKEIRRPEAVWPQTLQRPTLDSRPEE